MSTAKIVTVWGLLLVTTAFGAQASDRDGTAKVDKPVIEVNNSGKQPVPPPQTEGNGCFFPKNGNPCLIYEN